MTTITPIYSTTAHATGDGRNGQVQSDDGLIDLPVLTPTEHGGPGGATNPEQLLAAGYAACFHSALRLVARAADIDVTDSAVSATVHLGSTDVDGFVIAVELSVRLPQASPDEHKRAGATAQQVRHSPHATRYKLKCIPRVSSPRLSTTSN